MNNPKWLDTVEYPFKSNYFELPVGKMHYVDQGKGEPIVFMHGNPGWSFEYRETIKELSKTNRCIAADYIGFGLSDKPFDWNYLPENYAKDFETFINSLNLKNITFVMNDWGGPLAMNYALKYPEKIKHLFVCNTWFWSVKGIKNFENFSGMVGGKIGKFLTLKFNFIGKMLTKKAHGKHRKLTKHIHKHYYMPHSKPEHRKGTWVFPKEIIGSSDWLNSLWEQRNKIKHIPTTIIWGDMDIAFKEEELEVWTNLMLNHTQIRLKKVGHFPPEEAPEILIKELKKI